MRPTLRDVVALVVFLLLGVAFVATLTGYIRVPTPTQAQREAQLLESPGEITIHLEAEPKEAGDAP